MKLKICFLEIQCSKSIVCLFHITLFPKLNKKVTEKALNSWNFNLLFLSFDRWKFWSGRSERPFCALLFCAVDTRDEVELQMFRDVSDDAHRVAVGEKYRKFDGSNVDRKIDGWGRKTFWSRVEMSRLIISIPCSKVIEIF